MTRRPSVLVSSLALVLGLVIPGASTATPAPSSVQSLGAVRDGDVISVTGVATFGGIDLVSVGTDPTADFAAPAEVGMDLTGALIGQPDPVSGDLVFVLRLADLPPTGALPETVRYSWDFGVRGVAADPIPFEIDGKLTDIARRTTARNPAFFLRGNCTTANNVVTCADVEGLAAALDPAAKEIRVIVPRRLLEDQVKASLAGATIVPAVICEGISTKVAAYFTLCGAQGQETGDELVQEEGTAYPVATRQLQVAVAPAGQNPDFATATAGALTPDGTFLASVDATGVPEGDYDVWARACFGANCGAASVPLGTPSTLPTPTWAPPVLVHGTQAHRETSIALSPTNPNLMTVCDPSGVPATATNQSYFHRSTNGGNNWAPLDVEGPATDPRNYAFEGGDCDVAFDAGGTAYSADTWLGNLSIGHSTDGGATWDGTSLAVTAPIVDRPWLVGGPAGTIHVTYEDLQCCMPATIWYTRSTDFGKTFLPVVPVADAGPDGAFTWEGNFVVSPDGSDLYLVYTRRQGPALGSLDAQGPETVWVAASHDAGLTWTSTLVAAMPNPASYLYPSIGMDAGGYLHVVYASRRAEDRPIWYSFSKNGAKTWSTPVPILSGAAGYSPWIAGGRPGEAAITWYGGPDPATTVSTNSNWFFYYARVTGADKGTPSFQAGTTTVAPIFKGVQGETPEFEMIRLDANGMMHIGMSAKRTTGGTTRWAIYYQRQVLSA